MRLQKLCCEHFVDDERHPLTTLTPVAARRDFADPDDRNLPANTSTRTFVNASNPQRPWYLPMPELPTPLRLEQLKAIKTGRGLWMFREGLLDVARLAWQRRDQSLRLALRRAVPRHATFTTLLMSTGLTFGTISSLYGLTAGIIDETQFSLLITVVLSAVVPTAIAERWFLPSSEEEALEPRPTEVPAEEFV
jgi:hypothetical protein